MTDGPASDLERLLEVQRHDTHTDQLRHQRETLEERQGVAAAEAEVAAIDDEIARVEASRDELARQQKREEDEAASFADRVEKADRQLYGGTISNPRELQALQDDIAGLKRHQSDHEDRVLDLMEQIEPLQAEIGNLRDRRAAAEGARNAASDALVAAEAVVDAQLADVAATREAAVEGIATTLLEEYAKLRGLAGGVAIARLSGNRCDGCHLTLSAVEVDRIRHLPTDQLAHCEECGRMLVR